MRKNKPLTKREQKILLATRYDDLTKTFPGHTRRFLHDEQKRLRSELPDPVPVVQQVAVDSDKLQADRRARGLKKRYEQALEDRKRLEDDLRVALELQHSQPIPVVQSRSSGRKSEMAAIAMLSDLHVDETVKSATVNGMNSYGKQAAHDRMSKWARNVCKMLDLYRNIRPIRTMVVPLLGDLITGNIHAENLENTWCAPVEGAVYAQGLVAGALDYVLENGGIDRLLVPCKVGNHARITKKPHHQEEVGNSLELFVYAMLAQHFADDPRVTFELPESYLSHIEIMGLTIGLHHGHGVRGGSGIGGVAMPLLRHAHKADSTRRADMYLCGHFHQALDLGHVIANGSLIGFSAYGLRNNFPYTKPSQSMILIDSHYGRGPVLPIWVD